MIGVASALSHDELLALPAAVRLWPDAGRAIGLGRTKTFELFRAGKFPCRVLRLGNALRVPRAELFELLGVTDDGPGRAGTGRAALSADSGRVSGADGVADRD